MGLPPGPIVCSNDSRIAQPPTIHSMRLVATGVFVPVGLTDQWPTQNPGARWIASLQSMGGCLGGAAPAAATFAISNSAASGRRFMARLPCRVAASYAAFIAPASDAGNCTETAGSSARWPARFPGERGFARLSAVSSRERIDQAGKELVDLGAPGGIEHLHAVPLAADQACLAQHAEMLRKRGLGHGAIVDPLEIHA